MVLFHRYELRKLLSVLCRDVLLQSNLSNCFSLIEPIIAIRRNVSHTLHCMMIV